jgi:hypothetical protein
LCGAALDDDLGLDPFEPEVADDADAEDEREQDDETEQEGLAKEAVARRLAEWAGERLDRNLLFPLSSFEPARLPNDARPRFARRRGL